MSDDRVNILITGAGGYIGRQLSSLLSNVGHNVSTHYRQRPAYSPCSDVLFGDLRHCRDFILRSYDLIIHAAATSPGATTNMSRFVEDNILSSQALFDTAIERGCDRIILLSAISVFGEARSANVDENTPCRNPDDYGLSKRVCERLLEERQNQISGLTLRLPGILGQNARTPWLARVRNAFRVGEPVSAYAPTAPFNNALHVEDLSRFIQKVCRSTDKPYDMVTLAAEGYMTIRESLEKLHCDIKSTSSISFHQSEKSTFTISIEKARQIYGFAPMHVRDTLGRFAIEP